MQLLTLEGDATTLLTATRAMRRVGRVGASTLLPLIVCAGSISCPPFRGLAASLRSLQAELSGRVAMVTVYILEAHADDEWPISSARFSADGRAVHVQQPRSNHGRCQLARRFVADFDFPETLVLVDPCDQGNPFEAAYAPWPLRFYGIAGEGRMGYVAHPRDCSYCQRCEIGRCPRLRGWSWDRTRSH